MRAAPASRSARLPAESGRVFGLNESSGVMDCADE